MPRIQTTRTVKIALFFLRFYLLALLVLILFKFVRMFYAPATPAGQPAGLKAATSQATTAP